LKFYAHYIETKVSKTGLTVTVDVYRNGSEIVTAGSATEVGDGLYSYELASGSNNAEGEYICIFKTATSTVDQQHIPALWVVNKAGTEYLTSDLAAIDTVVDAIKVVTDQLVGVQSEPTGAPAANETPLEKLGYIFAALRNKLTVTSTAKTFFDDAGASLWSKTLTDDGTTYTEAEGA
jgi:S-adenosylmethionine synthetase